MCSSKMSATSSSSSRERWSPPPIFYSPPPPRSQEHAHLVHMSINVPIQDERNEQLLQIGEGDVELGRDEGEPDAGVGLDGLEQYLGGGGARRQEGML